MTEKEIDEKLFRFFTQMKKDPRLRKVLLC